jgi:ubiquinone/menaquinone biosynthesis C-methylase UbiE
MLSKEQIRKKWGQLMPGYYDHGNLGQRLWHDRKVQIINSYLSKEVKKLLDVGCADGYFLNRIRPALSSKTIINGVDVSEKLIKAARQKYPEIHFFTADAHKLPFKEQSFDLVICTETLEHVVEPEIVLAEMKRVVTDKGKILLELDSDSRLFNFIFDFWVKFFKGKVWQGAHLHRLPAKKLEKFFVSQKLTVIHKRVSHFGMAVTYLLKKS